MSKLISIVGIADKRTVVYPLLYCINVLGSGALFTDETEYRRLIDGKKNGEIGNISLETELHEDLDKYVQAYKYCDYIVEVNDSEEPLFEADSVIKVICDGGAAVAENTIRIGYEPSAKKEKAIILSQDIMQSIYKIESSRKLLRIKSSGLQKTLLPLFAEIFNRTEKNTLKLFNYKEGRKK